ncbi:sensor histidine kinase [Paraburkholderia unamae]|uniref:histidine kinase n=1 Tax=Paraburkholderia unamae TaxID=219649 RepID=A0ABX5KSX3_9BURK|nr:sensor histidine kinase [Paraburkholderia unamae]PVX85713.1 signal transduction histidine kinase [Paraburkholderia unamae]
MTDSQPGTLHALAGFLRREQARLTERWMLAVAADADLIGADRLTWEQLADHLPAILSGICTALEEQDLQPVERAIERNARQHGNVRWQQGYRIDELVRELELFRQELDDAVRDFAESDGSFTRDQESRARRLIDEALSFVTLTSIREVIGERDRTIAEYTSQLERANQELREQQREVSELHRSRMQITRSLVHDLRNFLNAFSIDLQLIARVPARAEAGLALATRQAEDMKQLVDEMVEYSVVVGESSPICIEPVDLPMLFDELVTAARPALEAKGLRLSASLDAGLVRVQSSRIRLKQVALNLLSNATKYTREGEVELVIARCGDSRWSMRVADTGVGIAPSDTERVFREFERVGGDDIPGAGLGLAIVRELCRALEGEIHFESREGQGTTFEIRFPVDLKPQG